KLNTNGDYLWAKPVGGSITDVGRSVYVDPSGSIYGTGYFNSLSADFDPGATTFFIANHSSSNDVFIFKLGGELIGIKEFSSADFISIAPCPASSYIDIVSLEHAFREIQLYNSQGKIMAERLLQIPVNSYRLNIDALSQGIYFIKAGHEKAMSMKKIIKQ